MARKTKEAALKELWREIGGSEVGFDEIEVALQHIVSTRPHLERHVRAFRLHYGVSDDAPMAYEAIGKLPDMNVSGSRARTMARQILHMLRDPLWWG